MITLKELILKSQLQMLSCLMELQMFSLLVNCWKFTIQRLHSRVGLNIRFPYFSMIFTKSQLPIRWLQLIRQYITCLALEYIRKPHYIFKSKSYEFHNRKIVIFSGNDTRMAGYFIGMHKDLRMRKALLATFSSAEFNTMILNSKLSKVVSYIQDKKAWERIYVLLKIKFPCLRTLWLADRKKSGMEKVFYYYRMKKISIIKSSTDIGMEFIQ